MHSRPIKSLIIEAITHIHVFKNFINMYIYMLLFVITIIKLRLGIHCIIAFSAPRELLITRIYMVQAKC